MQITGRDDMFKVHRLYEDAPPAHTASFAWIHNLTDFIQDHDYFDFIVKWGHRIVWDTRKDGHANTYGEQWKANDLIAQRAFESRG
jgi:hypothetical protein